MSERSKITPAEIAESLNLLTNMAAQFFHDICDGSPNLMLSVSTTLNHRLEMLYRINAGQAIEDNRKKSEGLEND